MEGKRGRQGPLSPVEFSVLLVLESGASWGYGIVKGIAERTSGGIRLAPGNLYQVLDRLLARGWIREVAAPAGESGGDARRRWYGLTGAGRSALRAEAVRLRELQPALERLALGGGRQGG